MAFTLYGDESDAPAGWTNNYLTAYPFPANAPVESTTNDIGGDNHVLILQTAGGGQPCKLWEVWQGLRNEDGTWSASNGAYWDLSSNALRTNGWTSADAAGLPIMPLTVNYDEVATATVTHPIRFTVNHMLNGYVWPARHTAGVGYCSGSSGTIPAGSELSQAAPPVSCSMTGPAGQIYRLTSSAYAAAFAKCPSSTHPQANTIITAMRQYGIILADNGLTGGLIGTPDARWQDSDLECLTNITLSEFEPVNVSSLRVSADSGGVASNLPICTLTAAPDSIRRGGSSMLTASCSPAASTYTWTGGTCAGVSLSTCNVAPGVSTSYTVTGTNSSGTSNSASAIVTLKVLDLTPILMLLLD
ncbi:MAG: hypothetical protein IPN53_16580 [Comamonadaceae bacterium]|nr:hypothetical protein [Comamonadaceae bacterium]